MRNNLFGTGRAVSGVAVLLAALAVPAVAVAQVVAPPAQKAATELPSARAVIDRHLEAVGGKAAIMKHTSTHLKGTFSMPANGISGPLEVFAAKPDKVMTKVSLAGIGELLEGHDGKVAWSVNPMTGAMLSTGKELEQKKFDADYFSDLRDSARYESMKVVEKTMFDGRECYKVSLVKKGAGGEDIEYYDVATGLRAGGSVTRETPMGAITVTQIQTDYKKFGDVLQPSTLKQSTMGVEQIITVTSVEFDKVDPAVFEPPAAIKALIK